MSDHPDLEALSAALDGQDVAAAAHARGCPACRAQLAELGAVQQAVGSPLPPPARAVMDEAIARAVAAAEGWDTAAEESSAAPTPAVTPGRGGEETTWPPPRRASTADAQARERRWRVWMTGSAAAAMLAVVVVTALLVSGRSRPGDDTALSAGPPDKVGEAAPGAAPEALSPGGVAGTEAPGVVVQELGDVADVSTLRSRASAFAGSATSAASSASAQPAVTDSAARAPRVVGTRVCEAEARGLRPELGVVVYVANLRFQGTNAVALGFAAAPGAAPVTLLVLAPGESCRVLAETTIP
jgi:hypothetical protein